MAHHYTYGYVLRQIVQAGVLNPSRAYLQNGEGEAVWFSNRADWEPLLNFCLRDPHTGVISRWLTRWDSAVVGRGLARIDVAPETSPYTYADFLASDRVSAAYRDTHARLTGHRPHRLLWRLSYEPVPRDKWIAIEMFDGREGIHRWRDWKELAPGATDADLDAWIECIPAEPRSIPLLNVNAPMSLSSAFSSMASPAAAFTLPSLPDDESSPDLGSTAGLAAFFDACAVDFEYQLTRLAYRVPTLLSELMVNLGLEYSSKLDILDLGCGTGLCAKIVKPYARTLIGVDLSAGMLAKAERRKLYDTLHRGELTDYLRDVRGACDVIVLGDVLPYVGKLDDVTALAAKALKPGGAILFSAEDGDESKAAEGYARRSRTGRYVHTAAYVERMCAAADLRAEITRADLRLEAGVRVLGLIVRATRTNDAVAAESLARRGSDRSGLGSVSIRRIRIRSGRIGGRLMVQWAHREMLRNLANFRPFSPVLRVRPMGPLTGPYSRRGCKW